MSLSHYYIDASKLPLDERKELFDKIDTYSYISGIDLNNIGCIDAFFGSNYKIEDIIEFPKECIVTLL